MLVQTFDIRYYIHIYMNISTNVINYISKINRYKFNLIQFIII